MPDATVPSFRAHVEPGQWVRLPERPDWGAGQVQSVAGERVTVNFAHAGKVMLNARVARIEPSDPDAA